MSVWVIMMFNILILHKNRDHEIVADSLTHGAEHCNRLHDLICDKMMIKIMVRILIHVLYTNRYKHAKNNYI
jgi:hypothetical protein